VRRVQFVGGDKDNGPVPKLLGLYVLLDPRPDRIRLPNVDRLQLIARIGIARQNVDAGKAKLGSVLKRIPLGSGEGIEDAG